jgi:signal peptidase I
VLLAVLATAAARWIDIVVVRGRSMAPTLLPGDRLVAVRMRAAPRRGQIVLAADPRDPSRELVKRVHLATGGRVALRGDNAAASTDGRTFGDLPGDAVRWRVVARCWPLRRLRSFG